MSDLHPYQAGHAAVADAIRAAKPLPSAHSEISALVADHIQIDPASGAVTVLDSDGTPALDRNNGFAPLSPAGFMTTLRSSRPWLFSENAKPQRSTASAPAPTPTTLTAMMAAAKRGDPAAMAAINARMKI